MEAIKTEALIKVFDKVTYLPPNQLVMQLTHKDVLLDFFALRQYLISPLNSGDELTVKGEFCLNLKGAPSIGVLKVMFKPNRWA